MQHPDGDAVLGADLGHVGALLTVAEEHTPLLFQRQRQHRRLARLVRIVQRLANALEKGTSGGTFTNTFGY